MIIQRTFKLQRWDDETRQAAISFWEGRGVVFTETAGGRLTGHRGSILWNAIAFNMRRLLTRITITVNDSLECTCELEIRTAMQIITSWNRQYWDLELDTFESVLLYGDAKSEQWDHYTSKAVLYDTICLVAGTLAVCAFLSALAFAPYLLRAFKR